MLKHSLPKRLAIYLLGALIGAATGQWMLFLVAIVYADKRIKP